MTAGQMTDEQVAARAAAVALEKANYPIRRIEIEERSADSSEIVATVVSTSVDASELMRSPMPERSPLVAYASWTSEQEESG